jgi:hypothetical protein
MHLRGYSSENEPHLVIAITIPTFVQLTGVIVVAFFAPQLFRPKYEYVLFNDS